MARPVPFALRELSFRFDAATAPLFSGLTASLPPGFTGVVGANGAGKSTLLRIVAGELTPDHGEVIAPGNVVLCPQRTDRPPAELDALLTDDDPGAHALRGRLQIAADCLQRWPTLSHGERKRAQIAAALWQAPDLLAIDEPTNHIDAEAHGLLVEALARFTGIGLIVSHDRALLDALCSQCLWLDPPTATLHPGGYSAARAQRAQQRDSALHERDRARGERDRLQREQQRRRIRAEGADRKRSKRGVARADHDAKAPIALARVTGKDGQAGRLQRQLDGRARQLRDRVDAAFVAPAPDACIRLPGSAAPGDTLLDLPAGTFPIGNGHRLRHPDLRLRPTERIAITGPNGCGKTTLLEALRARLKIDAGRILWLPQELDAARGRAVLDAVRQLPPERLGWVMTLTSQLGSAPQRLLASRTPSPGELRKLMLALGIAGAPQLIVMDEPTNHLDLPSIESLQTALLGFPGSLLLVSHDEPFLQALTRQRWRLQRDEHGDTLLHPDAASYRCDA